MGLFPVMLHCGTLFENSLYISHVISDCCHASPDLVSVFDTRACPQGIHILILVR